ncbi:hypothetical protein ISN44_As02g012160 [Arabidopsis suecica]|uniref:Uncharacterized protein n=1 Tax=Arabidopsis suecica TaxID=45249 RepID=A0A8T2FZK3_ARASU|nr:hypothetical protein ISN44_As02g012160 [Arabidopsis suecica]
MEPIEYNVCETSKCNSHVDDHGWKKVVSSKSIRKQKPADQAASGNQPTGEDVFRSFEEKNANVEVRNENLKAKESKKSKPKERDEAYSVYRSFRSCGLPPRNDRTTMRCQRWRGSGMVLRTRPNALAIVLPTLREKLGQVCYEMLLNYKMWTGLPR